MKLIDTCSTRNQYGTHIRHVIKRDADKVLEGTACGVITECKRHVIYFFNAEDTSYFYTDGTRYAWPCRVCLPDEYARLAEEQS